MPMFSVRIGIQTKIVGSGEAPGEATGKAFMGKLEEKPSWESHRKSLHGKATGKAFMGEPLENLSWGSHRKSLHREVTGKAFMGKPLAKPLGNLSWESHRFFRVQLSLPISSGSLPEEMAN